MRIKDSIGSPFFTIVDMDEVYNKSIDKLTFKEWPEQYNDKLRAHLLTEDCVLRGIPFRLGREKKSHNLLVLDESRTNLTFPAYKEFKYIIFLHSADYKESSSNEDGIYSPMYGSPRLGEKVCEYVLNYSDGRSISVPIKRRFNINEFKVPWGENSFECVPHFKPDSILTNSDYVKKGVNSSYTWGQSQARVGHMESGCEAVHWLYALKNPYMDGKLKSIDFLPGKGRVFIFGITLSSLDENPIRWEKRKRIRLEWMDENPNGDYIDDLNIDIDLGKVISVAPVLDYGNADWETGYNNKQPVTSKKAFVVDYAAHSKACLYMGKEEKKAVALDSVKDRQHGFDRVKLCRVKEPEKDVTLRVVDKKTRNTVPVKIHIHGQHGEYLAPVNRHRIPNSYWLEDYSVDFVHGDHYCTYINGEAEFKLPYGDVFIEISKGFEIKPVKRKYRIDTNTEFIEIELERVLNWRSKGWVTADTHVHFLSPHTALMEGEAEGVNIVNLLVTQWGEMFTNIGDFDGKTTLGSIEAGGKGEYMVRVGTENREHVLGHISLLGYEGKMITPLTTGGPDESAIGDAVEQTLSGWAKKCRNQNGISILPHFPNPRAEGAAAMVLELIDGVEMTSWGNLYGGISPYSLSDWYRYLNCGYQVPAVGGTDKMSADTAVGTVRTYALIKDVSFTYNTWKDAVIKGNTFVTYGPLLEFRVNGQDMGTIIKLPLGGGTLDIEWRAATAAILITKIELVVNGETREVVSAGPSEAEFHGTWSLKMDKSGWIALRIRGGYPDKPEMIAAHSSAIMVIVGGNKCFSTIDAMTIIEQIEGATAYIKTIGTRADEKKYKELIVTLTSAHRALHNRLHQAGIFHKHDVCHEHHKK